MTDIIKVEWLDDQQTAILVTYNRDGWAWDDALEAIKLEKEMIEQADGIVDILIDVRKSHWIPKNVPLSSGMRKLNQDQHPRQGNMIFVGAKGVIAAMANIAMKLAGPKRAQYHFAKTM